METVGEAIAEGQTHLEGRCSGCRYLRQVPWRMLPEFPGSMTIAELGRRLVCSECWERIDPASVKTVNPLDVNNHIKGGYSSF